jgi:ubiquitin carboxyl-terminal hydrolase 14
MSTKFTANVTWGKECIEIELDPSEGVTGLKSELQSRTGVPMERMKVMPKSKGLWKGVLKDAEDLSAINFSAISPPVQMLMMGSATLPVEPVRKTVFLEDLPPEEAARMVEPSGLVNLGNTCYLNSVTQCLRVIHPLRDGLRHYSPSVGGGGDNRQAQVHALLLKSLSSTLDTLDRSPAAISPQNLVMATKMAFPQMAQTGPGGHPMQQDAEEFYSSFMGAASSEMRGDDAIRAAFHGEKCGSDELNGATNVIDAVFGMRMEETLTCDELSSNANADAMDTESSSPAEPPVITYDLHRKLVCNIQGGSDASSQVNVTHIAEGIQLALTGKLEKYSEVLGRDAMWTRSQKIARLPPYLVVQFGRFYWKATPDSQDHAGVKCKVMKPVGFQSVLDVYDFCSDRLRGALKVARDKAAREEEDRVAKKLKGEEDATKAHASAMVTEGAKGEEEDMDDDLKAALAMSVEPEPQPPVGPGLPSNFRGLYELFAVVTHKGRDADGGHYMGWVKADNTNGRDDNNKRDKIANTDEDNDDWYVFDDDEVSPCKTEDILKLKGGGDWHMSYLNFYRAKK